MSPNNVRGLLLVVTSHLSKIFFSLPPAGHPASDSPDFTRCRKRFQTKYANARDLHRLRFTEAVTSEASSYACALAKSMADFIDASLLEITGHAPALNSIVDAEIGLFMYRYHLDDAFDRPVREVRRIYQTIDIRRNPWAYLNRAVCGLNSDNEFIPSCEVG